ncbi:MAG: cupin [Ponticaulis sp.]|nr:cupin [Ponticaulis sp.]|tara:strand:- start:21301 stop:21867 length:567 start_codon:yes stop_codon:yes gene_type:complete
MSRLTVFADTAPDTPLLDTQDYSEIAATLNDIGVRFERWEAREAFPSDASQEDVLAAYADEVKRICDEGGYATVDIIRVTEDTPNKPAIRAKFLDEHTHSEDEVRFFIEGAGVFYLRVEGKVHMVLCEQNDLISVPANTTHWFDMGPDARLAAIRFFNNEEGWVPNFTGSGIASKFPEFDYAVGAPAA